MKKLTAGFCAIALAAVPTVQAMAAPSISTTQPKDPVITGGTVSSDKNLVIKDVTTDLYKDQEVADVVNNFNKTEEKVTTAQEVVNSVQLKTEKTETVKKDDTKLEEAEKIVVKDQGRVEYKETGVDDLVKDFNKKVDTFKEVKDETTGKVTYQATSKTVADLLQDTFFTTENKAPQVESGNLAADETLVLKNADTKNYVSKEIKTVVEDYNSSRVATTVEETAKALGVNTDEEVKTTSDKTVDLKEYKSLTYFMDLGTQKQDQKDAKISFTSNGETKVKLTVKQAKNQAAEDLMAMIVDPETGAVSFVDVDSVNEETGEIELTVPYFGSITILTKGEVEEETAVTTKGTEIKPADYKSLFAFADMLVDDGDKLEIKETGEFQLTMELASIKDMNQEDLVIIVVNPDDGTVSYVEPDEYDPETGSITATFDHVGPFTIATKADIAEEPETTNKGNVILTQDYEALTSFVDLAEEDMEQISYDMDGHAQVKFDCELAIGLDENDIVVMTIDPETKEKKYLEPDAFDPVTGELTVTFENLGPFTVLTKTAQDEEEVDAQSEAEVSEEETEEASTEAN